MSSRRVVLAGWGQVTQGKEEPLDRVHDPIGLMAGASRQAFEMCGASDVSGSLDGVMVVKVMSANYASADQCLAERMGITPRFSMTSKIGGNSPQSLINKAAGMIARGELDSVLITGAEAYYPRDKSRQFHGNRLFQGFSSDYEEDDIIGATELEAHHGMSLPIQGFPLYETALWAESGMALGAYMVCFRQACTGRKKFRVSRFFFGNLRRAMRDRAPLEDIRLCLCLGHQEQALPDRSQT